MTEFYRGLLVGLAMGVFLGPLFIAAGLLLHTLGQKRIASRRQLKGTSVDRYFKGGP